MSAATITAAKRLQHDVKDFNADPIPNISAQPIRDDLFKWSVNMVAPSGPYAGVPIHLHLTFPQNYPTNPPKVELLTAITHPNVYGDWICLDMIKNPEWYSQPYQGWSSTYTLSAILLQLYGFLLLDETIDQDWGGQVKRESYVTQRSTSSTGSCNCSYCRSQRQEQEQPQVPQASVASGVAADSAIKLLQSCSCGHCSLGQHLTPEAAAAVAVAYASCGEVPPAASSSRPDSSSGDSSSAPSSSAGSVVFGELCFPESSSAAEQQQDGSSSSTPSPLATTSITTTSSASDCERASLLDYLLQLDDLALSLVLQHLTPQRLWPIIASTTSRRLAVTAMDTLQRQQQVCFYSKATASETVLMGFGVHRQWHHSSNSIRCLSTRADYLSAAAFAKGVCRSAWNHPIDAFLPLYLNPQHGERALVQLPQYIAGMLDRHCTNGKKVGLAVEQVMTPKALLTVMAQLINSLVVELMDSRQAAPGGGVSRSMSDAALQTFCHLHHLLLAAALQPGSRLTEVALKEVQAFVDSPAGRSKQRCPDLGVLLVQLLLVPQEAVPWSKLAPVLLRELLARQVRWIIKDSGRQAFGRVDRESSNGSGGSKDDLARLSTHLRYGGTGLRNVMLQVWFANALARPGRQATLQQDLAGIKATYDACSGMPPLRLFRAFNAQARYVLARGCSSWRAVLHVLHLGLHESLHPRKAWVDILRQAVMDSYRAGYHSKPDPPKGFTGWSVWDKEVPPVAVVSNKW